MRTIYKPKEIFFVLGIIENVNSKNKVVLEALKIYNPITEECYIESLDKIMDRIDSGQEVVGVRIKVSKYYSERLEKYIIKRMAIISQQCIKYKDLTKLNGYGEIITPGKGVVIGCVEKNNQIKYVVVSANLNRQYFSREEVIQSGYIGVYRNQLLKVSQIRIDEKKQNSMSIKPNNLNIKPNSISVYA